MHRIKKLFVSKLLEEIFAKWSFWNGICMCSENKKLFYSVQLNFNTLNI